MPFFDDSGYDETIDRGQFWSAFAIFGSQLEKMIAVNIVWALQFAPAEGGTSMLFEQSNIDPGTTLHNYAEGWRSTFQKLEKALENQ